MRGAYVCRMARRAMAAPPAHVPMGSSLSVCALCVCVGGWAAHEQLPGCWRWPTRGQTRTAASCTAPANQTTPVEHVSSPRALPVGSKCGDLVPRPNEMRAPIRHVGSFITLASAPHLNGTGVVFGRVTSGLELLHAIETGVTVDADDKPTRRIRIAECGEMKKPRALPVGVEQVGDPMDVSAGEHDTMPPPSPPPSPPRVV